MSYTDSDEESFIVLGSSPESLNTKCNEAKMLETARLDETTDYLPDEANKDSKAQFNLSTSPSTANKLMVNTVMTDNQSKEDSQKSLSPSSMMMVSTLTIENQSKEDSMKSLSPINTMMVSTIMTDNQSKEDSQKSGSSASTMKASTLIMDNLSREELQKLLREVLDENVVLKHTIKLNNECMKEQYSEYSLIASCQEDMIRTHRLHQDKFEETKALVEKLRLDNKKLREEIVRLNAKGESLNVKSGPSSGFEFVTPPDDDVLNKLITELGLVDKKRLTLVVENEKLTWQKDSLDRILNAITEERDKLKEYLNALKLQLSSQEKSHKEEIEQLNNTIGDLRNKLLTLPADVHSSEIQKRDEKLKQLEGKVASLQNDLKKAQITILDFENIKLDFAKYKGGVTDMVKTYKEQIKELHTKIDSIQKTVFKPVDVSVYAPTCEGTSQYGAFAANCRLYDRTLKYLAEYLNNVTSGLSSDMVKTMGAITSLQDVVLDRASIEKVKTGLFDIKNALSTQHNSVVNNITQLKGSLTIFEGIFKDYKEVLEKNLKSNDGLGVDQLTAALMARGEEVLNLENEIAMLVSHKEDCELLKTQIDLYRTDFEAERKSREEMAGEKEKLATDLRILRKKFQERENQLDEIRKMSPSTYKTAVARVNAKSAAVTVSNTSEASTSASVTTTAVESSNDVSYTCPKCSFTTNQYAVLQDHFDFCLDDI